MKILVTGGSGFLGINLIRYLLCKKYEVRNLDIVAFEYPDVSILSFKGDIRNKNVVASACKGMDVVVHCAAALPLYSKEEIYSTDVQGTRNVLEAAHAAGVKKVIHISSTAVYGIPNKHPLFETDPLVGVGHYGKAKILAEKECLKFRRKMKVPILRPKSFIGPERLGVFALLYDWALDGRNFPMIGSGRNRYQLLDVEDLCVAIELCIKKNVNSTYNIGAKEFTTMKEDFQAVLDYEGGGRVIGFPAAPMVWTLRILEKLHLSPLYKWVYETAYKDSFVSISKAEKELKFHPKYSNKQALIRNYIWYKKNLKTFAKAGVTHRVPWKQGVLKIAKLFF